MRPWGKRGSAHSSSATARARQASVTVICAGKVNCSWFCGKVLTLRIVSRSTCSGRAHTIAADDRGAAGCPAALACLTATVFAQPASAVQARAAMTGSGLRAPAGPGRLAGPTDNALSGCSALAAARAKPGLRYFLDAARGHLVPASAAELRKQGRRGSGGSRYVLKAMPAQVMGLNAHCLRSRERATHVPWSPATRAQSRSFMEHW